MTTKLSGPVIALVVVPGCDIRLGIIAVMAGMIHGIMARGMATTVGMVHRSIVGMIPGTIPGTTAHGAGLTTIIRLIGAMVTMTMPSIMAVITMVEVVHTTTDVQVILVLLMCVEDMEVRVYSLVAALVFHQET